MSDIFNNIFEGIKIGRRETRIEFSGLIREMCDMLDHLAPEIEMLGGMDPPQRGKE